MGRHLPRLKVPGYGGQYGKPGYATVMNVVVNALAGAEIEMSGHRLLGDTFQTLCRSKEVTGS